VQQRQQHLTTKLLCWHVCCLPLPLPLLPLPTLLLQPQG
jgi:hypothetical protein